MTFQEMLEKRDVILIKDLSENPPLDEWKKMGRPEVLILADKCGDFELYDEIGYGRLFLVQSEKIVDQGRDFVHTPDLQIFGLGPAYGCEPSALYKRLPWYFCTTKK